MGMIADEFLGHGAALESNFAEAYHSRNRSGTGAGTMSNEDVPSPIDFHDLAQAKAWEAQTVKNRPWRPQFFAAFVAALQGHFDREFSVLELGSGPGHLVEQILRHCAIGRYVALDFSEPMHALARTRLVALAGKVEFLQRDFRAPDWNAGLGPFDAVVTMQAAHEVRHRHHVPALLAQARQCLAPGGLLLYCDHYAEAASAKHADLHLRAEEQRAALHQGNLAQVQKLLDLGGMALYSGVG
jgi:SAM-dependent methyltransferase